MDGSLWVIIIIVKNNDDDDDDDDDDDGVTITIHHCAEGSRRVRASD